MSLPASNACTKKQSHVYAAHILNFLRSEDSRDDSWLNCLSDV